MIVLDASIVVELLTNGSLADTLRRDLAGRDDLLIVPYLLDIEVVSALRRLNKERGITPHRARQFFAELASLPAERFTHLPLLSRIWELRDNFTCYDAAYIALAEATDSTLYTSDRKLRHGHKARVRFFSA